MWLQTIGLMYVGALGAVAAVIVLTWSMWWVRRWWVRRRQERLQWLNRVRSL